MKFEMKIQRRDFSRFINYICQLNLSVTVKRSPRNHLLLAEWELIKGMKLVIIQRYRWLNVSYIAKYKLIEALGSDEKKVWVFERENWRTFMEREVMFSIKKDLRLTYVFRKFYLGLKFLSWSLLFFPGSLFYGLEFI